MLVDTFQLKSDHQEILTLSNYVVNSSQACNRRSNSTIGAGSTLEPTVEHNLRKLRVRCSLLSRFITFRHEDFHSRIDRNSLFKCRGRAPGKFTVKRRFRPISVTMRCCNTNVWRHCGTLATFALVAEWFPLVPLLSAVVVWRERAERFHATSTATFHVAFVTPARAVDCSHRLASDRQATAR